MRHDDAPAWTAIQAKMRLEAHHQRDEREDDEDAAEFPDNRFPAGDIRAAQSDQRIDAQIEAEQDSQNCVNYPPGSGSTRPSRAQGRCHGQLMSWGTASSGAS